MSKKLIGQSVIAVLIVAILGIVLYVALGEPVVEVSQTTGITAYGKNQETGKVSSGIMNDSDVEEVIKVFNGKKKTSSSPGDLFSEDCAFVLTDGDTEYYYCLANDGTNYVCSANEDMYFSISSEERSVLVGLLSKYCGYTE